MVLESPAEILAAKRREKTRKMQADGNWWHVTDVGRGQVCLDSGHWSLDAIFVTFEPFRGYKN